MWSISASVRSCGAAATAPRRWRSWAGTGKPVVLEIDPPVDEIARRRQGFYQRCGFAVNPYPHVHPPYRPEYPGHELVVLSSPRALTPAEYGAFACYLSAVVMA